MKVGLSACCLNTPHIRGMGKYVFELVKSGATRSDIDWTLFAHHPEAPLLLPPGPTVRSEVFRFRGDRLRLWDQVGLPARCARRKLDLLHCTEGELPWWQPLPTVVTLHDTIAWEEHADTRYEHFYWNKLIPAALERCAALVTISESSRKDILKRWPRLEKKTSVIHHGIDSRFLAPPSSEPLPSGIAGRLGASRYLVYMGGAIKRKRFDWALKVYKAVRTDGLKLVACGFSDEGKTAAAKELETDLRNDVIFTPFLAEEELKALYEGASAVLYPTTYEGFGFPAVEAQATAATTVFSPVSSLAELVGPSALAVGVDDFEGWVHAVKRGLAEPAPHRLRRREDCIRWAQRFTWSASLEKHLEVYEAALAGGGGRRREAAGDRTGQATFRIAANGK